MLLKLIKNDQAQSVFKSYLTVIFVSSLCGLAAHLWDKSFWAAFCLTTALQFIVGYVVSAITINGYRASVHLAELDKLEKLSTIINCAYCNASNVITFLPEEVPLVKCDKCNNTSNVKLHFTISRQTSIASNNDIESILKEPQKNHNIKL